MRLLLNNFCWIITFGLFLYSSLIAQNKIFYPIKILLHCTLYSHSHTCVCSWMGSAWEYMVSFRSLQNFPYLQPYFQWLCHPIFTEIMLFNLFKGHLYLLLIWQKHKPLSQIQQNSLLIAQKIIDIPAISFCQTLSQVIQEINIFSNTFQYLGYQHKWE